MRHLLMPSRRYSLTASGLMRSRFVAIVQIVLAAGVVAISAPPVVAQKTSPAKPKSSQPQAARAADTATQAPVLGDGSYMVSRNAELRAAPGSAVIGGLQRAANVEVLSRDRGWARVRVEGWVPDSILAPADTNYRAGLSAADLMADPAAARGETVVWNVEFLALQAADPLRKGMSDGEPYILARGPDSENALLYLVVPPSLMGTARALQPLAKITVTARVRDGRSEPVGIPILDIQTIRRIR